MKIAVIPARGGSKRIPRKNIRTFAGCPIISYSINAARASNLFDDIIVSTDDEEIAAISRGLGASTPFIRPASLSDDHTGTTAVVAHAARWAKSHGIQVRALCCIYATAPFVQSSDLIDALALLMRDNRDYVFAGGRFAFPVERGFRLSAGGTVEPMFPEYRMTRSQDLLPAFHDAGQFYWGRTEAWIEERPIFGPSASFVEIPPWRMQDIDTEDDWHRAELLFEVMRRAER